MSMTKLKLIFLLTLAIFLVMSAGSLAAKKRVLPTDPVATVNGDQITGADLAKETSSFRRQYNLLDKQINPDEFYNLQKKVLENLINRVLLLQASEKAGTKVTDAEVDGSFEANKKRFTSPEIFAAELKQMGMSEADFKLRVGQEIAVRKYLDQLFAPKISVSDGELKSYYRTYAKTFRIPALTEVSHILIKVDPDSNELTRAGKRKKIEALQKRLAAGEDFAALAKENSECPSAADGGQLGYLPTGEMVKPFEEAMLALEPGQVSDIVITRFGYHLIKVTAKKPAVDRSFEDVRDEVERRLVKQKMDKLVNEHVNKLREDGEVKVFFE